MMSKPRLIVMGHGRHGKDTVCEILRDDHGFSFTSSSRAAMEVAIWPALREYYTTKSECFDDRANWRSLWFQLISRYNHPDRARLATAIFSEVDIYCGIRSAIELWAAKDAGLFEKAIWVDAACRVPSEPDSSITVMMAQADIVISNNGTLEQLRSAVARVVEDRL